jgi:hypothetical protein
MEIYRWSKVDYMRGEAKTDDGYRRFDPVIMLHISYLLCYMTGVPSQCLMVQSSIM